MKSLPGFASLIRLKGWLNRRWNAVRYRRLDYFIDRLLWAIGVGLVLILAALIFLSAVRDRADQHEGTINAFSTIVAAFVGLITLATLRHAIQLSQDENERQKDELRPIVLVSVLGHRPALDRPEIDPSPTFPATIDKFTIQLQNAGVGPAINVRVFWQTSALHLTPLKDVVVHALSMPTGTSVEIRYQADPDSEIGESGHYISQIDMEAESEFTEPAIQALAGIRKFGFFRVSYSDVFGRNWVTDATLGRDRQSGNHRWPVVWLTSQEVYRDEDL